MVRTVPYAELPDADLIVDAVYEGDQGSLLSGEALSHLLPGVGNLGGFRACGKGEDKRFVVLFTTGEDKDWPDHLDNNTGRFLYYGDNKKPGNELHVTKLKGNMMLRRAFDLLHENPPHRGRIPPFLVFEKYRTRISARSFQFKGLAVPGYPGLPATEDLIAIWKTSSGQRFQNYRAIFTILDLPQVSRAWLNDLAAGNHGSPNAPEAWQKWVDKGIYEPLVAESTTVIRRQEAQVPDTPTKNAILETVWQYFRDSPSAFEAFAARLFQMHDPKVIIDELTRPVRDGGRDAVGRYSLGLSSDPVYVEFALEAKCYRPPTSSERATAVGVREVSRLVSRIRHRQFGVLVTTSVIGRQAYEEVRGDRHPIVFLSGKDIADILTTIGLNTPTLVREMLESRFPIGRSRT